LAAVPKYSLALGLVVKINVVSKLVCDLREQVGHEDTYIPYTKHCHTITNMATV